MRKHDFLEPLRPAFYEAEIKAGRGLTVVGADGWAGRPLAEGHVKGQLRMMNVSGGSADSACSYNSSSQVL